MPGSSWSRTLLAGLLALLVLASAARADEREMRVFQLNHRPPSTVLDAVRAVLSESGLAVPDDRTDTLIVRDGPAALERVQALLQTLDVALPQVRVKVAFQGSAARSGGGVAVGWDPATGRVAAGGGVGQGNGSTTAVQDLLVMSGEEGHILVGRDLVTVQPYWTLARDWGLVPPGLVIQQVNTGFAVRPQVREEAITLTITPWFSWVGPTGAGDVRFSEAASTVSLRSGESVAIAGGSAESGRSQAVFGTILGFGSVREGQSSSMVVSASVQPDWGDD